MKIVMIGLGTVALADALALGRENDVIVTGPVPDRVDAINSGEFLLSDPCLAAYLRDHPVRLQAMLDPRAALDGAQMVFVSAPLSRDPDTNALRTIELESRIELAAQMLPNAPIVIRSAVPVGFTDAMRHRLKGAKLVYAPEFSRYGHALSDVLTPAFLIVGDRSNLGTQVGEMLQSAALAKDIPLRQMRPTEAEALRHLSVLPNAMDMVQADTSQRNTVCAETVARQVMADICLDWRLCSEQGAPFLGAGTGLARLDEARIADLAKTMAPQSLC
jgi:UDPglucose 6-dehydrogenase